jgi:hypothetical protein
MKKLLLLLTFTALALPSYGQCNLNLTNNLPDINAQCSVAFGDLTIPVITDSCGNPITPTTDGSIFPITAQGTTTITWTYIDAQGNPDSQTQDITIFDFTEPVPDLAILSDITSECQLLQADVPVPTATDNCLGTVTVTSDAVFPISTLGTTMITWTYTDVHGNSESQTQDVIIYDFTDPVPDAAFLPDIFSPCELLQTDVAVPTATDNCSGIVTVTSNAVFPIATTTTITWTYTDASGNSDSQLQDVYIFDSTDPTPTSAFLPNIFAQCELLQADIPIPTATDDCSGTVTVTSNAVFPITSNTTITWTYTDASGNSDSQLQDVYINDISDPTPDTAILSDVISQCAVQQADVVVPTATDNCSGAVTVTSDAVFPITATTTITWTYTDASGNSASQLQDVYINDFTEPVPDATVLGDIIAQCAVQQADVTVPTATDNCSGVVTVTNNATFPITASTTIIWTYFDANGNSESQTQDVIINDNVAPVPDAAALADINSQCALQQADITAPTATDNCSGVVTVVNDGVFPITASTTITWTFTDANGNSATQDQQVSINDSIAPTPDNAVLSDVNAQCTLLESDVTFPTATDNCSGVVTVTNDAVFPITASTTITWTYADASGNSSSQTQQVVISDTVAPTPDAALLADIHAQCEVLETDVTAPTATDNCSGIVAVTNNALFPINTQGTSIILWTYMDASGNISTQSQNIVINDLTGPTPDLAVLADIVAECEVLQTDIVAPTATDNCSNAVTITNNAVFPITTQGTTTIVWTYTDGNSNMTIQMQNVIIADATPPIPSVAVLSDISAECEAVPAVPTATDNCSGSVAVTSDTVFPITAPGLTLVTWTYTDGNGNATTQTQNVFVNDTSNPTFTLNDLTVSVDVTGNVTITPQQLENGTASDNCGIANITVVPNAFTCEELGDHLVTVTVTDIHGNAASATATVTVNDPVDFCGALVTAHNEKTAFVLYPNPTADKFYIQPGSNETIRSSALYSLSGQLLFEASYKQPAEKYSISLERFAAGTYLLKLETASGSYTRRVVKQ